MLNDITQKEFLEFQNSKWTNRRRMAWLSLLFYFFTITWLIYRTEPQMFGNYDGFMIQLSVFVGAILTNYFVANSTESVKIDRESIMKEFIALKNMADQARTGGVGQIINPPATESNKDSVG